ncbi:MAG: ABC transporter substrate-binding protein [Deltaproteobacteria bacterium]|nr:ABC transporter substrate-binding protein [Deltaproteobacteria bacterium]
MKRKILIRLICILSLAIGAVDRAQAQDKIVVGYDGTAGFQGPIWAAHDLGLLERHGFNAELVMIPGGARGMQALLSGSTQFAQGSASAPVSVIVNGGDLVIVAVALNKFPFSLVAQKEIRKPTDLVGKKIGIVNFGGSNELAVLLALKEWNIAPNSVTLLPAGDAATRLIAMTTRVLDATVLAPPETLKAKEFGLNIMAHISEMKASFPQTVITVRRSSLGKNRDMVKRFVRAYSEAIYQFRTNKERALNVYARRLRQRDPKVIEETYGYFAGKFSFPPRLDRSGMVNALSLISQRSPGGKSELQPEQFIDESVLDELESEGFFNKVKRSGR